MRHRALKVLATAGKCLGLGTVFVSAALTAVVLHADAKPTRRLAASVTNRALSTVFLGKLEIGEVTHIALGPTSHVRVAQVEIFDPEGHRVIVAKGVDAKIDLEKLVRSVAAGRTPEVTLLDETSIAEGEVVVDLDAKGDVGIARAFGTRPSTTPKPPQPAAVATEDVRLSIPRARLKHAHVRGNVVPPQLDGDVDDVRASVVIVDNRLTVVGEEAQLTVRTPHAPSQTGPIRGKGSGSLLVPLVTPPGAPPGMAGSGIVMHWELEGDAAGVPLKAHFGLDGEKMDVAADIAPVAPDVLRKAMPLLPVTKPVEVHAKGVGTIAELGITANGKVGDSAFTANGRLTLHAPLPFQLDADLTRIDGAAFTGPDSDVSGHVHVEGAIGDGSPQGTFTVGTKASTIAAQPAPAVTAEGSFDERSVKATFRASEPGVEVSGKVEVRIPEQELHFDVNARSNDLRKLARAPGLVSGSGTAHATGKLDLARSTIDARVTAHGSNIGRAPASAGDVRAEATIRGPVADPIIDVTAKAQRVALVAASEGDGTENEKAPLVYPTATARARIVLSPKPTIRNVQVHVEGTEAGTSIDAKAREIVIGPGGVDVRGGRVTGLGAPLEVDVRVQNGALSVRARGENVDMKRLSAMTGIKELRLLPEGSRASMDVDVKAGATRTDGHIDVVIAGAKDGSTAELHATLDGRHVTARARVAVGSIGWVEMQRAEIELPGSLSVATMKRAKGALDLRGEIDLAQGAALLGGESIEQMSGIAVLSARVERGDADNLPTVYASGVTRGLDVTLGGEGTSTHIGGIDGSIHVGYDGATDETELSALTWDVGGIVGSADLKARVPLVGWATGVKPFDRRAVGALEVVGVVDIPQRDVAALPGVLARPDLHGKLSAHAEASGTIESPHIQLVAHADDLREKQSATAGARFAPIDGVLDARWDGNDVVAALRIDENERVKRAGRPERTAEAPAGRTQERKSGHVRGLVIARVPAADLMAGRPLAWNASGELDVADLELAPLPLPMNLRGALTGRVKLRDLSGAPLLEARAHVTDLGISGARMANTDVTVEAKNGSLSADVEVRQADGGSGSAHLVSRSLQWRGAQVAWDDAQPTRIEYALDRMSIAVARPFVRTIIPEIDGRVNGRGSALVDAKSQVFEGGLVLSDGRLYVNALGEEITGINAVANFERDGGFRVQDLRGKIGSGELKASASGRMKGLRFESAQVVAVVPTKDGVPLSAEGATFAEATGEVRLSAKMSPDRNALLVTVTVPRSKITLPDRGTQNLQALDPDETIAIGVRQKDGTLAPQALRPGAKRSLEAALAAKAAAEAGGQGSKDLTAKLTVTLGNDVELEGRGLRLGLGGRTVVDIAEEVAVTGQIALKNGGTIDVQGRKFVVDRGTVSFVEGDLPSNPIVIAAAYWDAPDRTRVWVEFNGPLKTGKLTLRSEPPYSKNEILSILLFGRADPNQAKAGDARPSDAQAATAVGTGIASSGLNKALGELDEDFDLEQDRTSANRTRTKLGYRLRRNLKVQLGYASGFSPREPDTTYLFLEWQFVPKWSLIGTRGNRGTSILDVIFQHRY